MAYAPEELRNFCLSLPEATEKEAWGDATFRVRDRMFAVVKQGDGRLSVWLKPTEGSREMLLDVDPEKFFVPPYLGPKGWLGVRIDDRPDWDELRDLVARSYRLIAPKKLAQQVELSS